MLYIFLFISECRVGTYGQDCEHRCECENSAGCDPVLGDCICTPGWDGRRCDQGNCHHVDQKNKKKQGFTDSRNLYASSHVANGHDLSICFIYFFYLFHLCDSIP